MTTTDALLTVENAAKMLAVSPRHCRRMIASRQLRAVRLGRRAVRIAPGEIQRIIQSCTDLGARP